jgi:hypothetical protein
MKSNYLHEFEFLNEFVLQLLNICIYNTGAGGGGPGDVGLFRLWP